MSLGTWLLSLITPLTARLMAALGFSVVTIGGMQSILTTLKDQFLASANAMPADVINLFLYIGGGQALGIITGAMTTKFLLWQVRNTSQILGWNQG